MACNSQTPADGATPAAAPSSPARPTAPASCSSPDSLFSPCCNSNCRLPGCSASMNFCANCQAERLLKQECADVTDNAGIADLLAEGGSERGVVNGADTHTLSDVCAVADRSKDGHGTAMAGISVLRSGVKSKDSPVTDEIAVAAPSQGPSAESRGHEILRIPSPLSRSPPLLFDADLATGADPPRQRKVTLCALCSRRVGLLGFKCRCGDLFCAFHRYFDSHRCSFDYKAAGRLAIARENPLVVATKIVKI